VKAPISVKGYWGFLFAAKTKFYSLLRSHQERFEKAAQPVKYDRILLEILV